MLKVNLIGNLGADVDQHVVDGKSWYVMNVAHTSNVKGVSVTEWCSVVVNWNAEKLIPYLVKGAKVFVHGTAFVSQYEDSKHAIRYKIHVIADYVQLCGGGSCVAKDPGSDTASLEDIKPF